MPRRPWWGRNRKRPQPPQREEILAGTRRFVFLSDKAFQELYETPTLLSYGFNMEEAQKQQMEQALSDYVESDSSVAYTSTKLIKEQADSIRNMILVVGSVIGCIMAFAGLINFTNMIITNMITRRHEFATLQSIGMTKRQLRRLVVYEGVYYAVGADVIGSLAAAALALTVLKML